MAGYHRRTKEPVLLLPPPRRICNRCCLSVCLLATLRKNLQIDLREIFREGWQWPSEQMIILVAIRITDLNPDPHRDTDKTCLGGGVRACTVPVLLVIVAVKLS